MSKNRTGADRARAYRLATAVTLVLTAIASPGIARTVPFPGSMAEIRAAAADQGIEGPFSESDSLAGLPMRLELPTAADHRVTVVSVYCQVYGIDNPVSLLLADLLRPAATDGASAPGSPSPAIALRMIAGSTVLRCMGKTEVTTVCLNRVRLTAEVRRTDLGGASPSRTITAQVERRGRVGGFCGNIARYTGIVTREAGFELLRQAEAFARETG